VRPFTEEGAESLSEVTKGSHVKRIYATDIPTGQMRPQAVRNYKKDGVPNLSVFFNN